MSSPALVWPRFREFLQVVKFLFREVVVLRVPSCEDTSTWSGG